METYKTLITRQPMMQCWPNQKEKIRVEILIPKLRCVRFMAVYSLFTVHRVGIYLKGLNRSILILWDWPQGTNVWYKAFFQSKSVVHRRSPHFEISKFMIPILCVFQTLSWIWNKNWTMKILYPVGLSVVQFKLL